MQRFVIDRARENFLVVEEMQLLAVGQRDLRMFLQKIMERGGARFLRTGDNEIEMLHSTMPERTHETNRATADVRCPRDKFCNRRRYTAVLNNDDTRTGEIGISCAHRRGIRARVRRDRCSRRNDHSGIGSRSQALTCRPSRRVYRDRCEKPSRSFFSVHL